MSSKGATRISSNYDSEQVDKIQKIIDSEPKQNIMVRSKNKSSQLLIHKVLHVVKYVDHYYNNWLKIKDEKKNYNLMGVSYDGQNFINKYFFCCFGYEYYYVGDDIKNFIEQFNMNHSNIKIICQDVSYISKIILSVNKNDNYMCIELE